nr:DUF4040 family protein [Rhodococcus sp. HNM0569]
MVWVLLALVACAAVAPVLDRWVGRLTGWVLAGVFVVLGAVLAVTVVPDLQDDGVRTVSLPWIPSAGIEFSFRLDGTALLFLVLVIGVGALVMAYSAGYFSRGRHGSFYVLMSLFAAAMFGLVLADDIVLLAVFWEFTTICSFLLIGRSGAYAAPPAVRTFLLTGAGGLALIAAVAVMWAFTGTTSLSAILADPVWHENNAFSTAVAVLIILAVFTKSAQFPFHYWLPDAMAAATPVSAYLHAAAMVKAGIYLLMRFSPALSSNTVWQSTLIAGGLLTAVIGAVFALQRHDLKELLAYSTVSQLGFLVAVIGVGTPTALAAAGVHTLAHALFKATLFMLVGVIDREVGSRDIREMTGLWRVMPFTAVLAGLSAASMAGLPPLLGFVSKENLFGAYLEAPGPAWVGPAVGAVAVGAAVLTFAYSFRIVYGAFGGPTEQVRLYEQRSIGFRLPAAVSSLAGLVLGLRSDWLAPLVDRIALDTQGAIGHVHLTLWYGFTPALWMSVITIGLGVVAFWQRSRIDRLLDRRLFPVEGTRMFEAVLTGSRFAGGFVADYSRSQSPTRHLAAPLVVLVLAGVAIVSTGVDVPPVAGAITRPIDWLFLLLIAAGVLGTVMIPSRLGALAVVGIVGFSVALVFFELGAPDVGLTQMLVEVLTVVVAVLVLRRLPRRFRKPSQMRRWSAAAFAVVAGVAAFAAVYLLTGRRDRSPAAEYFLTQTEDTTGATNIVNSILVDFRALDTLGELTVLGVAGFIVVAVLDSSDLLPTRAHHGGAARRAVVDPTDNSVLARTVGRWVTPVLIVLSAYLFLRGHYDPGGGFIAALVGGAAFALAYLAAPSSDQAPIKLPYIGLICAGVAVATVTGLLGFVDGGFLTPLHAEIPLPWGGYYHFTTAMVFDVGVYLAVIGVILTSLNRLGTDPTPDREENRAVSA